MVVACHQAINETNPAFPVTLEHDVTAGQLGLIDLAICSSQERQSTATNGIDTLINSLLVIIIKINTVRFPCLFENNIAVHISEVLESPGTKRKSNSYIIPLLVFSTLLDDKVDGRTL